MMAEKKEFEGVKYVQGDPGVRRVVDEHYNTLFEYNPKEWQLDVVLTRRFVPGTYAKFRDGVLLKEWGSLTVIEATKSDDLSDLVPGYEWHRVTIEVVGE